MYVYEKKERNINSNIDINRVLALLLAVCRTRKSSHAKVFVIKMGITNIVNALGWGVGKL